jgi:hypothetical protein
MRVLAVHKGTNRLERRKAKKLARLKARKERSRARALEGPLAEAQQPEVAA